MLKHSKKKESENGGSAGDGSKLHGHSEVHQRSSRAPRVLHDPESLVREDAPTDFVLFFENGEFHVHRFVLEASSKYFQAVFRYDALTKRTGRVKILGVTQGAGKLCLDYMYKGKVEIGGEDPESLVFASELMQLRPLTNIYFEFWKKKIGIQDSRRYLALADKYKHPFFDEYFKNLSPKDFLDIMRINDIQGSSSRVFMRFMMRLLELAPEILKMLNIDFDVWRRVSPELLLLISFGCSTDDFLREIQSQPLLCKNQELQKYIVNFGRGFSIVKKRFRKIPKYILATHYTFGTIHALNLATNRWTRFAQIPADILAGPSCDMVSVRGNVYITSHRGLGTFENDNFGLLSENRFFTEHHCCVVRNDVIYIIQRQKISKYNTRINTWTEVRTRLSLSRDFFVTSSNEHIYAMGGHRTKYRAFKFDFGTERWERIRDMQEGKYAGAAFWYNSKVYATGNRDRPTRIECYTPELNQWAFIDWDYSCKRCDFKAFVIGPEIYFVGFEEGARPVDGDDSRYAIAVLCLQKKKIRLIDGMWIDSRMSCVMYSECCGNKNN